MQTYGMPWPGDEGQQRWKQAWMAIKKVWASKLNERAYFSTRKVKLGHDYLCMAVLVQEIINADYALVIDTANPSSGGLSEIYAEDGWSLTQPRWACKKCFGFCDKCISSGVQYPFYFAGLFSSIYQPLRCGTFSLCY